MNHFLESDLAFLSWTESFSICFLEFYRGKISRYWKAPFFVPFFCFFFSFFRFFYSSASSTSTMKWFLVVNFCFLCCLLVQRSSCRKCFVTNNRESGYETVIGTDRSKLSERTCIDPNAFCVTIDNYTADGKLGKFNWCGYRYHGIERWTWKLNGLTSSEAMKWASEPYERTSTTCWTQFRRLAGQWSWEMKIRYEQIWIARMIQYGQLLWKMKKSMQNLLLISFY